MKESIAINEFYKIVENEDDLHILDVRPRKLYDQGHVPGAVHFPLSTLEDNLDQLDVAKHYYTICHDGKGAKKAAEILDAHGFNVTRVIEGTPEYPGELEK